ncbi:hypothetical protein MKX03_002262 [Papaver bracteatum]|nr:hypothetical protein MKX03_002262 [Papaver bracteatum]
MGSILYLAREKFQLYNHLLDLERRYQDLLNDVPSPSRNYDLLQTEYIINFTKLRWKSIYIPPLEDQFVPLVNTESTKKEEVFIDELVPEFSQDLTPNSLPNATLDFESICGSNTDSDEGGFLRSTSNTEDSAISIVDFTVSPSEEIKSIPTDFEDEHDDSINFELLIPLFFFDEEEELSDVVNFQASEVTSNKGSCKKLQSLKDFVSGHNKVFGKNRFVLPSDYSGSIFDRGKYAVVPPNFFGKLIPPLIPSLGFKSDLRFTDSIIPLFCNDVEIHVDGKMFVKMLLMDIVCCEHKLFFNHALPTGLISSRCFK